MLRNVTQCDTIRIFSCKNPISSCIIVLSPGMQGNNRQTHADPHNHAYTCTNTSTRSEFHFRISSHKLLAFHLFRHSSISPIFKPTNEENPSFQYENPPQCVKPIQLRGTRYMHDAWQPSWRTARTTVAFEESIFQKIELSLVQDTRAAVCVCIVLSFVLRSAFRAIALLTSLKQQQQNHYFSIL